MNIPCGKTILPLGSDAPNITFGAFLLLSYNMDAVFVDCMHPSYGVNEMFSENKAVVSSGKEKPPLY